MIQFEPESDRPLFQAALEFGKKQVQSLIENHPDFYPMYTEEGNWKHDGPAWTQWCDGFLPGMMWIFRKHCANGTAEEKYWLDQAIRYTKPLEPCQHDSDVHDLGFIFLSTYLRWYRFR